MPRAHPTTCVLRINTYTYSYTSRHLMHQCHRSCIRRSRFRLSPGAPPLPPDPRVGAPTPCRTRLHRPTRMYPVQGTGCAARGRAGQCKPRPGARQPGVAQRHLHGASRSSLARCCLLQRSLAQHQPIQPRVRPAAAASIPIGKGVNEAARRTPTHRHAGLDRSAALHVPAPGSKPTPTPAAAWPTPAASASARCRCGSCRPRLPLPKCLVAHCDLL